MPISREREEKREKGNDTVDPMVRGKNENESDKRELIFKEDGQEYAVVSKMLGNGWVEANCCDGTKRLGHIRGAFRKKVW